ncbi:MAG: hypothetical protein ACTSYR_01950 [Candidatus Odinarchaeia archaeon]
MRDVKLLNRQFIIGCKKRGCSIKEIKLFDNRLFLKVNDVFVKILGDEPSIRDHSLNSTKWSILREKNNPINN